MICRSVIFVILVFEIAVSAASIWDLFRSRRTLYRPPQAYNPFYNRMQSFPYPLQDSYPHRPWMNNRYYSKDNDDNYSGTQYNSHRFMNYPEASSNIHSNSQQIPCKSCFNNKLYPRHASINSAQFILPTPKPACSSSSVSKNSLLQNSLNLDPAPINYVESEYRYGKPMDTIFPTPKSTKDSFFRDTLKLGPRFSQHSYINPVDIIFPRLKPVKESLIQDTLNLDPTPKSYIDSQHEYENAVNNIFPMPKLETDSFDKDSLNLDPTAISYIDSQHKKYENAVDNIFPAPKLETESFDQDSLNLDPTPISYIDSQHKHENAVDNIFPKPKPTAESFDQGSLTLGPNSKSGYNSQQGNVNPVNIIFPKPQYTKDSSIQKTLNLDRSPISYIDSHHEYENAVNNIFPKLETESFDQDSLNLEPTPISDIDSQHEYINPVDVIFPKPTDTDPDYLDDADLEYHNDHSLNLDPTPDNYVEINSDYHKEPNESPCESCYESAPYVSSPLDSDARLASSRPLESDDIYTSKKSFNSPIWSNEETSLKKNDDKTMKIMERMNDESYKNHGWNFDPNNKYKVHENIVEDETNNPWYGKLYVQPKNQTQVTQ